MLLECSHLTGKSGSLIFSRSNLFMNSLSCWFDIVLTYWNAKIRRNLALLHGLKSTLCTAIHSTCSSTAAVAKITFIIHVCQENTPLRDTLGRLARCV